MSSSPQFKRVNGRDGKIESICMKCLLAVGICSSEEELAAKERAHKCKVQVEKSGLWEARAAGKKGRGYLRLLIVRRRSYVPQPDC
jgi:hypothetical protein